MSRYLDVVRFLQIAVNQLSLESLTSRDILTNSDVSVKVLKMPSDVEKTIDRQMLYEEVWSEPVSVVALRYGLSDVGLAKICRSFAIPLPSRGYWAKISSGREMKRVPPPPLDERRTIPTLKRLTSDQISERIEAKNDAKKIREDITTVIVSPDEITEPHPLVKMASRRLRLRDAWPTDTKLRCASGEVLNLSVTPDSLDRALHIVDALLKAFEANSITAHVDSNRKVTLLKVKDLEIEMTFSLIEQIKRTVHEETRRRVVVDLLLSAKEINYFWPLFCTKPMDHLFGMHQH